MMNGDRPEDFEERWRSFVDFFNTVKTMFPVEKNPWMREVQDTFFDLLNMPSITNKRFSLAHGLTVLERVGMTSKDAGFVLFIFVVFGAVWGNGGVLPLITTPATNKTSEDLQ
jgi:hypothetical protein